MTTAHNFDKHYLIDILLVQLGWASSGGIGRIYLNPEHPGCDRMLRWVRESLYASYSDRAWVDRMLNVDEQKRWTRSRNLMPADALEALLKNLQFYHSLDKAILKLHWAVVGPRGQMWLYGDVPGLQRVMGWMRQCLYKCYERESLQEFLVGKPLEEQWQWMKGALPRRAIERLAEHLDTQYEAIWEDHKPRMNPAVMEPIVKTIELVQVSLFGA